MPNFLGSQAKSRDPGSPLGDDGPAARARSHETETARATARNRVVVLGVFTAYVVALAVLVATVPSRKGDIRASGASVSFYQNLFVSPTTPRWPATLSVDFD